MKTIIVLALVAALAAGAIYMRKQQTAGRPEAGDLVAVWDTSGSAMNLGCSGLVKKVRERLADPEFRSGKNSRFALIRTGGSSTSYESTLEQEIPIPGNSGGAFGKGKREQEVKAFLDQIADACSKLPAADGSAIFRSVQIALNYMKSRRCGEKRTCDLLVGSDGLENESPAISTYLYSADPKAALPPETLPNDTARLTTWCGWVQLNETGGPRTNAQTIMDRWSTLFTRPQTVTMQPYCSDTRKTAALTVNGERL